jgi:hypothetical protein
MLSSIVSAAAWLPRRISSLTRAKSSISRTYHLFWQGPVIPNLKTYVSQVS